MTVPPNSATHTLPTNWFLWRKGMHCAARNLLRLRSRSPAKHTVRLALCPIDLWRYHEFRAVLDAFDGSRAVLDIGSPKLLARILAETAGATVHATDIASSLSDEQVIYSAGLRRGRVLARICDARFLPFADESFGFCYSVSAIEHIGGDGDTSAIRELARVTCSGGIVVVTVPFVSQYAERWVRSDPYGRQARDEQGRVFFSRYYDWDSLVGRIIGPSGLRVASTQVWQETKPGWYDRYCDWTARATSIKSIATKVLDPIWAVRRIQEVGNTPPSAGRYGVIALIFRKPEE
jgi:SAM-dependent methyltransferase